jgi:hypothetical protein
LHPAPIVHDGQGCVGRVRDDLDAGGAGVECVGDDLGEDRFLERAAVGIAEVFEQMLQIDPRFSDRGILPASLRRIPWPRLPGQE